MNPKDFACVTVRLKTTADTLAGCRGPRDLERHFRILADADGRGVPGVQDPNGRDGAKCPG